MGDGAGEEVSGNGPGGGHPLRVAIVGSGPAGFYAAEALAKAETPVEVDIIDRLPTPYGLVRAGVAPDHQSIKGVIKRYERTANQENVRFFGNVTLGQDVSLAELDEFYDAVILATGAPVDRLLGIPGDDLSGVVGSAEFVGWYNSHPDFSSKHPNLDIASVAVIGNGNVAIDVARVLAKTPGEMAKSDLADYAAKHIHAAPIKDIWLFGRRGPMEASFAPKELGELGTLENCTALVNASTLPDEAYANSDKELPAKRKILGHLASFSESEPDTARKTLHIEFYARPIEVLGSDRVEGLKMERTRVEDSRCVGTGETFEVPCQMVVPCIGYRSEPIPGAPFDEARGLVPNENGVVRPGLYVVGWVRRGPSGTIGTNRPDAQGVVANILDTLRPGGKAGHRGLRALLEQRNIEIVTFQDWKKIEDAEAVAARGLAPRAKFAHIRDMLAAVR